MIELDDATDHEGATTVLPKMQGFHVTEEKHTEPAQAAYEYTVTTYRCAEGEGCGFETQREEEAVEHYGMEHAVSEKKTVADREFLRFENEAAMAAFVAAHDPSCGWPGQALEGAKFPGWFHVASDKTRCARGCCDTYRARFETWENVVKTLDCEIATAKTRILNIQGRIRALHEEFA